MGLIAKVSAIRVKPLYVSGLNFKTLLNDPSRVDCIPMVRTSDAPGWSQTRTVRIFHDYAITRSGTKLARVEDLKTARVLAYPGAKSLLGEKFREAVAENPNYREIYNHRAQIMLLLQGSVDVIIADRLLATWYLKRLQEEDQLKTKVVFHDLFRPVAHGFVCHNVKVAAAFSAGVTQIDESGQLAAIAKRYGLELKGSLLAPPKQDSETE